MARTSNVLRHMSLHSNTLFRFQAGHLSMLLNANVVSEEAASSKQKIESTKISFMYLAFHSIIGVAMFVIKISLIRDTIAFFTI